MPYRLTAHADSRIDQILLESAREHGIAIAGRYSRLILAAMSALGDDPNIPGSRDVARLSGVRAMHLRHTRRFVPSEHRITSPRHLLVYRQAQDGVVEILGIAHDRMVLARAAREAQRAADQP